MYLCAFMFMCLCEYIRYVYEGAPGDQKRTLAPLELELTDVCELPDVSFVI